MHNKSELYDLFFRFTEGDHFLTLVFITLVGFGPLVLMALKQNNGTSWITSLWFMAAVVWFAFVCTDVSGFSPWVNQGL